MNIRCLLLAIASVAVLASLADSARSDDKPAAPFCHVVIFKLKKEAPADEVNALITDSHEMLRKIPSVRDLAVGKPANKGSGMAKRDYQVALLVRFADQEGLDTYAKHPLHLQFIEKHGKHVELSRLMIYDFLDEKK